MSEFAHLDVQTEYTAGSVLRTREAVTKAAESGQKAMAITDTNLDGAVRFQSDCRTYGIKPIHGMTVNISQGENTDPLILLAKNRTGWKSLVAIHNAMRCQPQPRRTGPLRTSLRLIEQHADGLVFLPGADLLEPLVKRLGNENVFLASHRPDPVAAAIAAAFDVTMVAVDSVARARAAAAGVSVDEVKDGLHHLGTRFSRLSPDPGATNEGWLLTEADMLARCRESWWQEAVAAAGAVADLIDGDAFPAPRNRTPRFPLPAGFESADQYLRALAKGADEEEIGRIEHSGTADCFLIVKDLIDACRHRSIPFSNRGTSAGSTVLYALGVTSVNPAEHGLLPERFMAPVQNYLPDMDFDFPSSHKDTAAGILAAKWGKARVAHVTSFFRVREEGPFNGLIKGYGLHPCGYVLSDTLEDVPLRHDPREPNGLPVLCWDGEDAESMGLFKLDLLTNRTLTAVAEVERTAREAYGEYGTAASGSDKDAWDLIASGAPEHLFQISHPRTAAFNARMRPSDLTGLAVSLALTRPGAYTDAELEDWLASPAGFDPANYTRYTDDTELQARLHRILGPSRGEIVFQEQIMALAGELAGFDARARADLRKVYAKKNPVQLRTMRNDFTDGARDTIGAETADRIFDEMTDATRRAFVSAHAHSYALLALTTARLSAAFPADYRREAEAVGIPGHER